MIMSANHHVPKFALGRTVATPAALEALENSNQSPQEFLIRHLRLEQGDLCDEDHELNKQTIEDGSRILSSFHTAKNVKLWVITEAEDDSGQRAATTILLPEEY